MLIYEELLKVRADVDIWQCRIDTFLREAEDTANKPLDMALGAWTLIKTPATHSANLSLLQVRVQEQVEIVQKCLGHYNKLMGSSSKPQITTARYKKGTFTKRTAAAIAEYEGQNAEKKRKLSLLEASVTASEQAAAVARVNKARQLVQLHEKYQSLLKERDDLKKQMTEDLITQEAKLKSIHEEEQAAEKEFKDRETKSKENEKCQIMANQILETLNSVTKTCKDAISRTKSIFLYLAGELQGEDQHSIESLADLATLSCLTAYSEGLFENLILNFHIDKMPEEHLDQAKSVIKSLSSGVLSVVPKKRYTLKIMKGEKISFEEPAP